MNFRQLTLLLCIGTGIAYSATAHAMNEEDLQSITPAAIVRQMKNLEDVTDRLTSDVASLKQQLDEQREYQTQHIELLQTTQVQVNQLTEVLKILLTPKASTSSNP